MKSCVELSRANWNGDTVRTAAYLALWLIAPSLSSANDMGVAEAYEAIPHRRTVFDVPASTLASEESRALKHLFELTDRGVVLRVRGLRALNAGDDLELKRTSADYRDLTEELSLLSVPSNIDSVKTLVLQSIQLHSDFFASQRRDRRSDVEGRAARVWGPDVVRASEKLRAAYGLLIKAFPNESGLNRQAFYDHLCALDFL